MKQNKSTLNDVSGFCLAEHKLCSGWEKLCTEACKLLRRVIYGAFVHLRQSARRKIRGGDRQVRSAPLRSHPFRHTFQPPRLSKLYLPRYPAGHALFYQKALELIARGVKSALFIVNRVKLLMSFRNSGRILIWKKYCWAPTMETKMISVLLITQLILNFQILAR